MLEEMRRLFAAGSSHGVYELSARPLLASNPEAVFWQALLLPPRRSNRPCLGQSAGGRDSGEG